MNLNFKTGDLVYYPPYTNLFVIQVIPAPCGDKRILIIDETLPNGHAVLLLNGKKNRKCNLPSIFKANAASRKAIKNLYDLEVANTPTLFDYVDMNIRVLNRKPLPMLYREKSEPNNSGFIIQIVDYEKDKKGNVILTCSDDGIYDTSKCIIEPIQEY